MKEKTKIRVAILSRVSGETVLYALLLFALLCMADRFPSEGYYTEIIALAGAFAVSWKYVRFLKGYILREWVWMGLVALAALSATAAFELARGVTFLELFRSLCP